MQGNYLRSKNIHVNLKKKILYYNNTTYAYVTGIAYNQELSKNHTDSIQRHKLVGNVLK